MIIVQLMGGLGNQLFQYAMGRNLSLLSGDEFKIDISFFEDYEWHAYSLAPFAIEAAVATKAECDAVKKKHSLLFNKVLRKTLRKGEVIVTEKTMRYNPAYKKITSPSYLSGYWQSEKYFEENIAAIRKEFSIKILPSAPNRELLEQISNSNAVSLHIRRGNYVSVAEFNKVLGTCSLQYYTAAMNYIEARSEAPVYYVFSDDIAWAKENLKGNCPFVFVDINDAAHDYEDIRLMQHCKHHIIANSTFSWWGAWLNPSPGKIVIAPEPWFVDVEKNKAAATLIPGNWIKIK